MFNIYVLSISDEVIMDIEEVVIVIFVIYGFMIMFRGLNVLVVNGILIML